VFGTYVSRYKLEKMSDFDLERHRLMAPSIEKEVSKLRRGEGGHKGVFPHYCN
jgi:hypothetical protein